MSNSFSEYIEYIRAEKISDGFTGVRTFTYTNAANEAVDVREFYKSGRLHREDGPAIQSTDGLAIYCLGGVQFTEDDFKVLIAARNYEPKTNNS